MISVDYEVKDSPLTVTFTIIIEFFFPVCLDERLKRRPVERMRLSPGYSCFLHPPETKSWPLFIRWSPTSGSPPSWVWVNILSFGQHQLSKVYLLRLMWTPSLSYQKPLCVSRRVVALPLSRWLGVRDRVWVHVTPVPKLEAFYLQKKKQPSQVSESHVHLCVPRVRYLILFINIRGSDVTVTPWWWRAYAQGCSTQILGAIVRFLIKYIINIFQY